jgi:hypothetical protein
MGDESACTPRPPLTTNNRSPALIRTVPIMRDLLVVYDITQGG